MSTLPTCPQCKSALTYEDAQMYVCPECAHEWTKETPAQSEEPDATARDAHGNILRDGDTITVIKDLKVKGAGQTLKQGTVIRSIRLTGDPEEIDCRHDTIKGLVLRAEFVRKA